MALSNKCINQSSTISKMAYITSSYQGKNPFVLFNHFSPVSCKYPMQFREELLLNAKLAKNNRTNNNSLILNTLKRKSSSMTKALSPKYPLTLTPYQQYEKLREDSFNQLKRKLESNRPFNTQNEINTTTKENKRKDSYGQTQGNYSNRRITQEEINSITNILAKKYIIKQEAIHQRKKVLIVQSKRKKPNKYNQMIQLNISPLHKITLSYCKSYQHLNQSPIEYFSI